MSSENGLIGISHEDNVPVHLQHLQKLKPVKAKKTSRPATAVEVRMHRNAAQEIKALQAEIEAEVRKRDHLESKLKKLVAVRGRSLSGRFRVLVLPTCGRQQLPFGRDHFGGFLTAIVLSMLR